MRRIRAHTIIILLLSAVGILLFSCNNPEFLSEEELKLFILEDTNELTITREVNSVQSVVSYKPSDLLILQEIGGRGARLALSDLSTLQKKYNDYYYFILNISKNNQEAEYQLKGGHEGFGDIVQILSFRMSDFVNLTTNLGDTIQVADYVYPRTFGLSSSSTLMFAFKKNKTKNKEWLQFNLKEMGLGIGNQHFRFLIKNLENIPKINFNTQANLKLSKLYSQ